MKQIIKIIIISIIFGGFSGVVIDRALLPYLSTFDGFKKYEFLKGAVENTTIINKTEQMVVKDEQNIFEIISKVSPAIVSVADKDGRTLGSGVVLTSDGIILINNIISNGQDVKNIFVVFQDGSKVNPALVKKTDNFTTVKVERSNLSVANFSSSVRSGEKIIVVGRGTAEEKEIITLGAVNYFNSAEQTLYTDAKNYPAIFGAGIFNIKGELIGLNVSNQNYVKGLILPKIEELLK